MGDLSKIPENRVLTPPDSKPKSRILIVDDHPGHRELLCTLLGEAHFAPQSAESVAEAKVLLQKEQPPFDLILSDVNMPEESGFDLIAWAKRQKAGISDVPVLFITSELPEPEHRIRGLSLGAVDYVSRSLDIDELVLRVEHAIENFRRLTQLKSSLESSEKRALAGRLLAASNHEIKNLATLIKVSTDQLVKIEHATNPNRTDFRSQLIESLKESSSLLVNISRNIGNLVTSREGTTSPVDMTNACSQAILILKPQVAPMTLKLLPTKFINPAFSAEPHDAAQPCWVAGNRTSIMQILINLVLNGADAIHEMGLEANGALSIGLECQKSEVSVVVTDNGIGFSEGGSRDTFNAFESTKHLRGGQGLGLWLCQQLAEAMGGKLTLSSAGPGLGASARLTLKSCPAPDTDSSMDLSKYFVY